MQGRADGDGGRAKGNAKKRDLDDALKVGLGTRDSDAKRRHTAGGPGHQHDESTPNSSSFHSDGRDVKRNGTSNSFKSQRDTLPFSSRPFGLPAQQAHRSLRPPNSGDSAPKASRASGASQGTRGAKPGLLGGLFSGFGHYKSKQNPVPNGPPTSSSTWSDASSVPAGSTEALNAEIWNEIPRTPWHSLRYGHKPADRAAGGEGKPQSYDRPAQGARSRNADHAVTGSQRRQSDTQDNTLPASRLKGKRRAQYDDNLSYDVLYLEDDDEDSDEKDDEHATAFPKTRQGSARLGARGSSGSLLKGNPDAGSNGERKPRQLSYDKTPSGSGLRLHSSSSSVDAEQDSTSTNPSDLDRAMAESKVWAYVAPFVPQNWTTSFTDRLETSAFIQAISLPLRNKMDMEWLSGTKKSHQRAYRALMSVIFQAIGVEARCKPCESKILERRRNCKVLPPEAEGMRELQEVCGSQCVNCYFFHATKPCEFPPSSTTTKQTPIPVPTPPVTRPMPIVERALDPPSVVRPLPAAIRPHAPTYSSYKATKAEKPISESPVPIPLFAIRGPNRQGQSTQMSNVSSEISPSGVLLKVRRSNRVSKTDNQSGDSSIFKGSGNTGEAESHSAVSNAGSSEAASASGGLASGRPSTKESTATASNASADEISSSQLAGRAFSLFGDMSRLPVEEQAVLWNQMQQMAGILQTGTVTRISITKSTPPNLPPGPRVAAAEWEIAPGRLIVDDKHLAFSTSFLSREIVSLKAAQQLSPTQSVLNKGIAALNQLSVGQEEGWDCTCSVIRGVLKMMVGDLEATIGQGGVIVIEKECIITNISHKEARIQVWWRKADG
ncbi:hypothetical protein INS49_015450 [Diaporthe citri]|uniref:uncharacterized protein n=1 Tax=Diaporthe citri TaxID=83186 RepID=UPI001C7ED0D4|nr:uncharacterized protein INS49_015450 [Diaporthe citri]KAG6356065.1 hypothetical protein INS49_015450 [Diaporthe citri]